MEVQPKEGIGEKGKSSSEIAYEIADMVMQRISLKIDPDSCHPDHLKVHNIYLTDNKIFIKLK